MLWCQVFGLVVKRTFGTIASVALSVSPVSNEEAPCEFHEQEAQFDTRVFSLRCFVYTRLMTWWFRSSLSYRNDSSLGNLHPYPTILTGRIRSWMCVRARVMTPDEDERRVI